MPEISILMSIYNTKNKDYLKKSLSSIFNQSFQDFELIIYDDGSTNDCFNWVKDICKNRNNVIFLHSDENKGLAHALNCCLKVSRGKYIARMDDDDFCSLDRLSKQLNFLKNNNFDLVTCNVNLFDDRGIYSRIIRKSSICKEDFLKNSPITHAAIVAKKYCFDIVNGYNEEKICCRVEDYDLFMRMFAKGVKMYNLEECLYNWRLDKDAYKRRQIFKYRINEFLIRVRGFRLLGLYPKGLIYIFKPIILSIIPIRIFNKMRKS